MLPDCDTGEPTYVARATFDLAEWGGNSCPPLLTRMFGLDP
jgi:hypothetical protein